MFMPMRRPRSHRGATFPEILLVVGLFSLLATFVVPPVMQWFQQSEVSRTIRSDCQNELLNAVRTGGPGASPGASKDCAPVGATAATAPAASAASSASR